LHIYLVLLMAATAAGGALSAPSGLNVIPTADIYDPGVASLEFETDGQSRIFGRGHHSFVLFQVGTAQNLEVGADKCMGHRRESVLLNAKYRLWEGSGGHSPVATGIQNVGQGHVAQPYVVGGWGFGGATRSHTGVISVDGRLKPMLGLDHTWRTLAFQTDWVGGGENSLSIGVAWTVHPAVVATYAMLLPNAGSSSRGHLLNVQYVVPLR
jgi:hypothetical protein